jgi:hypothetical protein
MKKISQWRKSQQCKTQRLSIMALNSYHRNNREISNHHSYEFNRKIRVQYSLSLLKFHISTFLKSINKFVMSATNSTGPFAGQMQNSNNVGAFGASLQPTQPIQVSKQTSCGF